MSTDNKSLKQIMGFRLEKLNKLREIGIDPFPHKFSPINDSFDIINNYEKFENQNVVIAGRVMNIRKMGKASFAHLMDNKGQIQLFIKEDIIGKDKYDVFKLIDIGDFIGIEGHVFKTKLGEISIRIKNLDILSKSIRPLPVVKEKDGEVFDAFSDKELRYRNRHIDLIVNPENRDTFLKRTKIVSNIRKTLDSNNFLEVETPVLQPIYGGANAKPFTTHHNSLNQKLYLRIADELYLKRLIIGGFDKVYEIAKNFRNEGMDRSHNPEFTMLEFYWAYADYRDCMILVETLIRNAAIKIGSLQVRWGENDIDLSKGFEELTFYGSLKDATGYDVSNMNREELLNVCAEKNITVEDNSNINQILDILMSSLVEPKLINPTFITDYPKSISPLAKIKRGDDNNIVERFELFIGGFEVANSFTELNDPIDQRSRLEYQFRLKEEGDDEAHPIDEDFIKALEVGMPPAGGVGIGIDRLVMLLTNNRWIRDVIFFPTMRAENT